MFTFKEQEATSIFSWQSQLYSKIRLESFWRTKVVTPLLNCKKKKNFYGNLISRRHSRILIKSYKSIFLWWIFRWSSVYNAMSLSTKLGSQRTFAICPNHECDIVWVTLILIRSFYHRLTMSNFYWQIWRAHKVDSPLRTFFFYMY